MLNNRKSRPTSIIFSLYKFVVKFNVLLVLVMSNGTSPSCKFSCKLLTNDLDDHDVCKNACLDHMLLIYSR